MEVIAAVAAGAIASACQNAVLSSWLVSICPQRDYAKELGERLSRNAHIYTPGSDNFAAATTRWSAAHAPEAKLVVIPSIENDVAETVKYANELGMPYLAVNGGHGAIKTVGKMKNGIQIWMHQLNGVELSEDETQAKIGGGAKTKAVTDALWAAGKQTVTGLCECTSILGPGLGGGHGVLQGRYGLVSDQFVSMNIVLADGSLRTIDESSDLWWAMKGAGHNFGIVTSVTSKIYDIIHRDWAYESFIFTGDKVEALYENINSHLPNGGSLPVDIMHYSFFFNNPEVDPNNPLIMFFIIQEGNMIVDPTYTKPFHDLNPIAVDGEGGVFTDLATWMGNANTSPPCKKAGLVNYRFPIDVESYNIPAQRQVYDLFASATKETPALNGSFFLFEGYSTQGVKAIPSESTAYPFRGDNLLISPVINYAAGADAEIDAKAVELGENLRRILHEGSGREEMHTYVNYAYGEETKQNMYGYEQWRQDKLLELKNKYDPERKFSFYAPIV
ncbi:FAD binding domain protein [Annulohypoxylon maeteangense]|uniref:FAD binding domain protein n=1 Tax=Annulohypoxylon maeteangense TaxID=1927788 RepID=UPI002008E65F|nr:FAD binding domain protein [Annulohypoxylon maeteangense]KAI0883287.1 FAD binding domain protein [Annulohypoxylon maeteangense]